MSSEVKDAIIKTIQEIPEDQYQKLLEVVKDFKDKPGRIKKSKWSRFAGILTDEQAEAMLAVIERECEVIENGD